MSELEVNVDVSDKTEEFEEVPKEFLESLAIKYADIQEYCEDADHFGRIVHELALFEIVIMQINEIFKDTLYSKDVTTLSGASNETVETLKNSFAAEFIEKTKEAKELSSLPTLDLVISWVTEIHENIATQLFTEEFAHEVLTPAYEKIAEAVIEISAGELQKDEGVMDGEDQEES